MARRDSPPDSPLSSMASSDPGYEEDAADHMDESVLPPAKRQKLGDGSRASSAVVPDPEPEPLDGMSDVSTDTSGSIPSSPTNARLDEEDFQEQVTACAWEGCGARGFANMDKLVEHIHNDHIEGRQKKYTCEWVGCNRKSLPHASGYALKAHMRSHTREKPFYCYLPECDRSFTRSDALAKHMRTVHETEALRPSDPIPKSMQGGGGAGAGGGAGGGKTSKLKIIIKTPQSHAAGQDDTVDDSSLGDEDGADFFTALTEDLGFTAEELAMPLERLHGLCRSQVRWAEADGEALRRECARWEELYKREWLEKEVLLDQVVKSEVDWHGRRQAVLAGQADIQVTDAIINGAKPAKETGQDLSPGATEMENGVKTATED